MMPSIDQMADQETLSGMTMASKWDLLRWDIIDPIS
jgi:hypothetical protein